ncbi:hypothetical protein Bp8pS_005 [Bacillus phage vB_BpuM-BpSp]|nr:hypothetical protein Bp8pS_005 [Bacillus phage vB_BpuM-BpSp]
MNIKDEIVLSNIRLNSYFSSSLDKVEEIIEKAIEKEIKDLNTFGEFKLSIKIDSYNLMYTLLRLSNVKFNLNHMEESNLKDIIKTFITDNFISFIPEKYKSLIEGKSYFDEENSLHFSLKLNQEIDEKLLEKFKERVQNYIKDNVLEYTLENSQNIFFIGRDNKIKTNYEVLNSNILNALDMIEKDKVENQKNELVFPQSQRDYLDEIREKIKRGEYEL